MYRYDVLDPEPFGTVRLMHHARALEVRGKLGVIGDIVSIDSAISRTPPSRSIRRTRGAEKRGESTRTLPPSRSARTTRYDQAQSSPPR